MARVVGAQGARLVRRGGVAFLVVHQVQGAYGLVELIRKAVQDPGEQSRETCMFSGGVLNVYERNGGVGEGHYGDRAGPVAPALGQAVRAGADAGGAGCGGKGWILC
ncbi:hypothetical protein AQJ46_45865 [Streptomyces canus]|uniref:Uncharacterized protein n=1 Tax=Streptomyces canus TaxID=58343 RepID=A0A101RLB9_9ACTN|nr:hypothetical protein [Streptomyces canus]KUN57747.1 hypothetical protein AQJ46_45865 [Streptomyces canus]